MECNIGGRCNGRSIKFNRNCTKIWWYCYFSSTFLYVFFSDRKSKEEKEKKKEAELKEEKQNNSAVLKELSASNKNIAESLNLLRVSIDINTTEFRQHDERAITNFNDIEKHLIKIEEQTRK